MGNAISACFGKYATFTGRANRSEYWLFYLFYVIVDLALTLLGVAVHVAFTSLGFLTFFLPLLAAGVRRLHDVDKSGWFILIPIYNLILLCSAGTSGENRYGPPTQL